MRNLFGAVFAKERSDHWYSLIRVSGLNLIFFRYLRTFNQRQKHIIGRGANIYSLYQRPQMAMTQRPIFVMNVC